jgi:hypothetical protein
MKNQSIVKSGAVIGGAIALLLVSAILAASPALAGRGVGCSLYPTGVEPRASGQATFGVQVYSDHYGNRTYTGTMFVTCKGLTPGQAYRIQTDVDPQYGGVGGGVADKRGVLSVAVGFQWYNTFAHYVTVMNAAGQIVLQGTLGYY